MCTVITSAWKDIPEAWQLFNVDNRVVYWQINALFTKKSYKKHKFLQKNGFDAGGGGKLPEACGYEQLIFEGEIELVLI